MWLWPELEELAQYVPGWRICYLHNRGADIQQHELDQPIQERHFRQWCFDTAERVPAFPFWVLTRHADGWTFYAQLAGTDKSLIVPAFSMCQEREQGPEQPGQLYPKATSETLPFPPPRRVRMDLDRLRLLVPCLFILEEAVCGEVRDPDSGKLLAGPCELFSFQAYCHMPRREP